MSLKIHRPQPGLNPRTLDLFLLLLNLKNILKTLHMGCGTETKDLILEYQKGCIIGCEEFKYLKVKIDKGQTIK